jgi:hypothetical protein
MDGVWATIEATNKQLKETSRIVGDLGNRCGDIAEHFLTPGLRGKFEKFGFSFGELRRNMELDALLENGTQAMVVEAKAKKGASGNAGSFLLRLTPLRLNSILAL